MWTLSIIVLVFGKFAFAQIESRIVQLEQGPVLGHKDPQEELYSYLNIPYATAPTGQNKFKAPLPPRVWTEPLNVTNKAIACIQGLPSQMVDILPGTVSMEEDCLVANIFVPDTNQTSLPVLVYVHGGAYLFGFSFPYRFNSLVRTKQVIVVTFNYRLGVQGFLCLGTEDIPGNAGLKDQVALLRWVNKNIARFGGNPNDVTISGCSAGGGSVDFLTLSPMTSGLFKKAITGSGAVLGAVGAQINPVENAKEYAVRLNITTDVNNFTALEEFYKTASYELLNSETDFLMDRPDNFLLMPCVERDTGTEEEKFIDDSPWNYLKNRSHNVVPLLYGFAQMEGLFRIPYFDSYKTRMNERFSEFLPSELQFENETQRDEIALQVKNFYFENQNVSESNILAYVDYFTDVMFAYPMLRLANERASIGDILYLFEYSFVDDNTPFVPFTTVRGANHCYQDNAVMDDMFQPGNHSEEYQTMRENMRKLWLNFIINGNPTPESSSLESWAPMNGYASPFMNLNGTMELVRSPLLERRVRFWDSIYEVYYRAPQPPSEPGSASTSTVSFMLISTLLLLNFMC